MTIKNENQSQNQLQGKRTNKMLSEVSDILSLSQLYEELIKACITLEKIFNQFCITTEQMKKARKAFGSSPEVWKLEYAKEFLDIIIANAALGNPQILENDDWLVQVTRLETTLVRE